jgi:hypothetical protein
MRADLISGALLDVSLARATLGGAERQALGLLRLGARPEAPAGPFERLLARQGWLLELGSASCLAHAIDAPEILEQMIEALAARPEAGHPSLAYAGVAAGDWFALARRDEPLSIAALAIELERLDVLERVLASAPPDAAAACAWGELACRCARAMGAVPDHVVLFDAIALLIARGATLQAVDPREAGSAPTASGAVLSSGPEAWRECFSWSLPDYPDARAYGFEIMSLPMALLHAAHYRFSPARKATSHRRALERVLALGYPVSRPEPGWGAMTLLHAAARLGSAELVGWLLERGADLDACNGAGLTPEACALAGGHEQAREMLARARARAALRQLSARASSGRACPEVRAILEERV